MIKESAFYKILSAIHIVFFTSILCFGMIYLSAGFLMLPCFAAVYKIGKDYLFKKLDITDSIIRMYFRYFKASIKLMKYFPVNLIMMANIAGMLVTARQDNLLYSILCLTVTAFLLVFVLYIAGYYTFVDERINLIEVMFSVFIRPFLMIPIFIIMVLCIFFFSLAVAIGLLLLGTFFLFAIEVVVYMQILLLKKAFGKLEEDEYAYLLHKPGKNSKKR